MRAVRIMTSIKRRLLCLVKYGKGNIRQQILLLVLLCGLLIFLFHTAIFLYTAGDMGKTLVQQQALMKDSVTDFVGDYAKENAKEQLKAEAQAAANLINGEMKVRGEDVKFMADYMSILLTHPENYRSRPITMVRDRADIVSGTPYLHYSPKLRAQGVSPELAREIAIAANIADLMTPIGEPYQKYHTALFVASKKGYMICMDLVPQTLNNGKVFASWEQWKNFVLEYDPTERPWYKQAEREGKQVYTDLFLGAEGFLDLACVMPYYDADGFAGVVGIGSNVEDTRRQALAATVRASNLSFALDDKGNVVFSSQDTGDLAPGLGDKDLRLNAEPTLAEAARRMAAGEADTTKVMVDGKEYFLSFAPVPQIGWSFGTLMDVDNVLEPVQQTSRHIQSEMDAFQGILRQIFFTGVGKSLFLLLPVILLALYGSGWMAARLTKPIHTLTEGVKEIAGGNLDKKLDIHTGNEIEHLADCFNTMTDDLKKHIQELSQAVAEKERSHTELEVAARIQTGMLPEVMKNPFHAEKFDLCAMMHPAKEVGGDFYDYYFLDEDNLVITIADVSGKGVPAALFMVAAKTLLKENFLMAKSAEKMGEAVGKVNNALEKNNRECMFVTAFLGLIHLPSGKFIYVNAGHNPPLMRHDGTFTYLPLAKNPVLGVIDGIDYSLHEVALAAGDALLLYTDGITEAMNEEQKLFTETRLKDTLNAKTFKENEAAAIITTVQQAVKSHVGTTQQSDDMTMLSFVYHG